VRQCFYFIRFWLDSIAAHTWDDETQTGAPIFLVGTHKDKVERRVDHEEISKRLFEEFGSHPAWRLVVPYKGKQVSGLNFYPVDNTKSRDDEVLCDLMEAMQRTIEEEAYVQKKVPLKWIAAFEDFRSDTRTAITFAELCGIAQKHGLPSSPDISLENEVKYMATYFSGLGFILYLDEPSLSDLVVLDPGRFMIGPATKLVCKPSLHVVKEHAVARKKYPELYEQYAFRGILDKRLLPIFWADSDPTHHEELEVLMIKYGLLVPLISTTAPSADTPEQYLLPALLPKKPPTTQLVEALFTCFLLFASKDVMDRWERPGHVKLSEVVQKGFFPSGVFVRLLGKAISKMQETSNRAVENMDLGADCAHVFYGKHLFRLTSLRDQNCVRLEILVESSQLVAQTVLEQARAVLAECVKNLRCNIGVPADGGRGSYRDVEWDGLMVLLDGERGLWRTVERKEALALGLKDLTLPRLRELFEGFLPPNLRSGLLALYDVFLSYRWTRGLDDDLTEGLFFSLSNSLVNGKLLRVFLDKHRLEDGRDFQTDFALALAHSRMIVPVVSHKALARMQALGPDSDIDNLMLEWTLAVALLQCGVLQSCFPVIFGKFQLESVDGSFVTNFFSDSSGTRPLDLPLVSCSKLAGKARELLASLGDARTQAPGATAAAALTVQEVVKKVANYQGHLCWNTIMRIGGASAEARFKKALIAEATAKIVAILEKSPCHDPPAPATPTTPTTPTTPLAAAAGVSGSLEGRCRRAEASVLGEEKVGGVAQRLKALEEALHGSAQPGSILARLEAIEAML